MLSFDFNGKNSFTDFGIYIEKIPNIPTPKRRVNYINMPYKNGSLKYDENTFEDITITVSCGFKGDIVQKIDSIKAWLCSGESDLAFSFDSGKKYIAQVVNSFDFEIILKRFSKFVIIFNAQPFRYLTSQIQFEVTSTSSKILNIGTVYSEPIIEVYGNGDVELMINNNQIRLTDIKGKVILNTVLKEIYNDNLENKNYTMQGEFPIFNVEYNTISFIGLVQKLIVYPNWRWL